MLTKLCTKCSTEKPLEEFSKRGLLKSGRRAACKECSKIENNLWVSNNKDKHRRSSREGWWKRRGIDAKQAGELWTRTSYCNLCGSADKLCIDHCHKGLFIRGVLCSRCNSGLGLFKDNIYVLFKAIIYLLKGRLTAPFN